ncbi:MAG: DUF4190 domain-containing protein [Bradyrhizobium sp.]|nr:DUF4190 domain-containing protein [Bradyrhizobium sp.]
MHTHTLEYWTHDHVFLGEKHGQNERRTWFVVALTVVMMLGEITAGSFFGSMALLADGWHMGTHAAALGIAGAAYLFARRQSANARFSFGTGKFGDLAAFSSALILGIIALNQIKARGESGRGMAIAGIVLGAIGILGFIIIIIAVVGTHTSSG